MQKMVKKWIFKATIVLDIKHHELQLGSNSFIKTAVNVQSAGICNFEMFNLCFSTKKNGFFFEMMNLDSFGKVLDSLGKVLDSFEKVLDNFFPNFY